MFKNFYAKIGDYSYKKLKPENQKCGELNQDKIGTAKGAWVTSYVGDTGLWYSEKLAALVHNNFDYSIGAFSFGNIIKEFEIVYKNALLSRRQKPVHIIYILV